MAEPGDWNWMRPVSCFPVALLPPLKERRNTLSVGLAAGREAVGVMARDRGGCRLHIGEAAEGKMVPPSP